MSHAVRLEPGPGRSLRDLLFERGVEFPCGGTSQCGACRVRVLAGDVPITADMRAVLDGAELAAGWRLGCQVESAGAVTVEVEQWSGAILEDREAVPIEPADGWGAVVDVGTTTLVAQVVDRRTGEVLGVETALNPQARHGADLMSRIRFERDEPGVLARLVREAVGGMLARLAGGRDLEEVLLVGNTAMHHLFCGLSVEPLAAVPFRSPRMEAQDLEAPALGWPDLALRTPARFLPCCGGFVGSDVLAGVVAVGLATAREPGSLLDLGTNGEIVVGDARGLRCASTAAGPAFEGGRISVGMRAGTGAIDRAEARGGRLDCSVIGGGPARGICGSGLVDAVAAARALGWIDARGRVVAEGRVVPLAPGLSLSQADVRELQLAKGAIAAGLALLLDGQALAPGRVFLAGAFGNYVRAQSARRIGLLPPWAEDAVAAGNTALRGARLLLLAPSRREAILGAALGRLAHVELATDPRFLDAYGEALGFPAG
jgi:uncharacterized 2Fe-2S/4Fe-4S cluster protein (DUF4445 family)